MRAPLRDLESQQQSIRDEVSRAIQEVVDSQRFILDRILEFYRL